MAAGRRGNAPLSPGKAVTPGTSATYRTCAALHVTLTPPWHRTEAPAPGAGTREGGNGASSKLVAFALGSAQHTPLTHTLPHCVPGDNRGTGRLGPLHRRGTRLPVDLSLCDLVFTVCFWEASHAPQQIYSDTVTLHNPRSCTLITLRRAECSSTY
ncbi:hypothetical protein SKAU_G00068820 [Synaphobranchus kaupii]|uniref:Uncharacterized protein n=1 Tax=Synaphobranchus kaupii TaxID=118154 RepID=A0A9Q1G7E5_SYNKA|nr:hypothetical protein SKAU_G00068820 [Synaphobranchus kaupii]